MLRKINTYFWYFIEYMKYGDVRSVIAAVRYLTSRKSHSKDRIIQSSIGKFFCRKNTNDFQFANFRYEWGVKRFVLDHIHKYSVFIDAGSCIGDYSILVVKQNVRSIAFEPVATNYGALIRNLELNKMTDRIKAYQVGLGNECKMVKFEVNPVNTGASHLDRKNSPNSSLVELRTFDSLLPELNLWIEDRILFKLDVEGMEIEALQGAANFIRQYPNITFVVEEIYSGRAKIKSILDELGSFEYGIVDKFNIYARKTSTNPAN